MSRFYRFVFSLSVILFAGLAVLPLGMQAREHRPSQKEVDEAAVRSLQTYQPPPADSLQTYCEPIRQEIVRLQHQSFIPRLFSQPRRTWLINKHRDCKHRIMDQEYTYLKHVDIQQAPKLPALNTEPDASAAEKTPASSTGSSPAVGPNLENVSPEKAELENPNSGNEQLETSEPVRFEFKIPVTKKVKPSSTETEAPSVTAPSKTPANSNEPSHVQSH